MFYNLLLADDAGAKVTTRLINPITTIANIGLALITLGIVVLAIYLAFRFAKAEEDTKRKNAKWQLIYTIIGFVGAVGITIIYNVVLKNSPINNDPGKMNTDKNPFTGGSTAYKAFDAINTMNTIAASVATALMSGMSVVVTYVALWIAFKMATADEEGKRKNAKWQLIYATMGALALVALSALWSTVGVSNVTPSNAGYDAMLSAGNKDANNSQRIHDQMVVWFAVGAVAMNLINVGLFFVSCYVAYKMAMAKDDGARKNAMMQLIYCVLGILFLVAFNILNASIAWDTLAKNVT